MGEEDEAEAGHLVLPAIAVQGTESKSGDLQEAGHVVIFPELDACDPGAKTSDGHDNKRVKIISGSAADQQKEEKKSTQSRMPWLTYKSPLARVQTTQEVPSKKMEQQRDLQTKEKGFVRDAVITSVLAQLPRNSAIPPYNAVRDKYASAYFQSPTVRAIMERNAKLRELKNERNKLSTRRRCKATPSSDELKQRRERFVVDAIESESKRSRFFDVIPPYQANADRNCKKYFQKPSVKKLLSVTLSPRS